MLFSFTCFCLTGLGRFGLWVWFRVCVDCCLYVLFDMGVVLICFVGYCVCGLFDF